jgi:hypothetical protein
MYELKKKLERYLRINLLGPGPRLYEKRIYQAAVSQRLRNTGLGIHVGVSGGAVGWGTAPLDGRFLFWFPVGFLKIFKRLSPSGCIQQLWGPLSLNNYHGIALGGKVQSSHGADNSAILVVLNVRVTAEAQYAIWHLSPHHLLCESFIFYR